MHLLNSINWALIFGPLIYVIMVGGFLDGYFVYLFLRPRKFFVAFGEALLANLFSLIVGFVSWPYIFPAGFDYAELSLLSYGALWLVTVLSEAAVLKLFNRRKSWKPVLAASILMNIISFVMLYLFFYWMN